MGILLLLLAAIFLGPFLAIPALWVLGFTYNVLVALFGQETK